MTDRTPGQVPERRPYTTREQWPPPYLPQKTPTADAAEAAPADGAQPDAAPTAVFGAVSDAAADAPAAETKRMRSLGDYLAEQQQPLETVEIPVMKADTPAADPAETAVEPAADTPDADASAVDTPDAAPPAPSAEEPAAPCQARRKAAAPPPYLAMAPTTETAEIPKITPEMLDGQPSEEAPTEALDPVGDDSAAKPTGGFATRNLPEDGVPVKPAGEVVTPVADKATEGKETKKCRKKRRAQGPRAAAASWSVSTRVMAALSTIAAVGLVVATAVFWWSENSVRSHQIDQDLAQDVATLRTLAGGVDPETGKPFATVDALLANFVTRNVPQSHDGYLVLIDGQVPFLPPFEERLKVEQIGPVIETAKAVKPQDVVKQHEVTVGKRDIRYVTVPVAVEGDPAQGVMVVAADVTAAGEPAKPARLAQVFIIAGTVILIGLAAAIVTGRLLRPLGSLAETADRITEEDLSQRIPVTGNDDIAEITRTVNSMLDRLEVAFQGHRELLDDVGHELRTPLTVISGQLEVMDIEDPADVRETRDLVIDETDRMARLVEELVLLAKSMRPDFVSLTPIAMDDVATSLMERATVLGNRRWRLDSLSEATINGDKQRLLQAGLQLASNAVRHTSEDDEIGIGAAVDGKIVRLWVRDTGEGVPAEEQQQIFERAVRGSSALARKEDIPSPAVQGSAAAAATSDTTSSGIGLSIVSAIAQAHGGRATLASAPGAGSTFAIEVPLYEAPKEGAKENEGE